MSLALQVLKGLADPLKEVPPPKIAKALAQLLSVVLCLFGVSTFLPNPLTGEDGYFAANATHAILYIVVALALFAFTTKGESTAALGLYTVSVVFLVLAIAGYLQLDSRPYGNVTLFGVILYSHSDLWLDVGLTGILFVSGRMNTSSRQVLRD